MELRWRKLRLPCEMVQLRWNLISPSMKAPLSSRKPCSGSSTSLAMPLLAAAQIICKWQPRGSEEDAVEIDDTMAAAKVIDTLMLDLVMMVAAGDVTVGNKCYSGKNFLRDILTLQNQAS